MFGGTYYVYATITGSNFDALTFSGVVEVDQGSERMVSDEPQSPLVEHCSVKWVHALTKTTAVPAWLAR
jgi:hypothetical protein